MRQMRHSLRSAGFRARGWRMGANLGARPDTIARIHARVDDIAQREGRAVHLVGWSLGGVFAREYAAQHPQAVASVVTMGSPFAGDPRANNAWRLYRLVTGHSVDNPPIARSPLAKPPVPTFALWSPRDGIVAPASARGSEGQRDEAIELDVRHLSFAFSAPVIRVVMDCLVRADQHRSV
jgi:pimeloyl-ACP methyl ester carboxylesterase